MSDNPMTPENPNAEETTVFTPGTFLPPVPPDPGTPEPPPPPAAAPEAPAAPPSPPPAAPGFGAPAAPPSAPPAPGTYAAPPPQPGYAPPPQPGYAPPQPGYAPPPQAGYAPQPGYAPVPAGGGGGLLSATWGMEGTPAPAGWAPKQKIVAGLLGVLLGGWGVHSFYLGNSKKGVIQLVVSLVTCGLGGLWGLIEGIMILIGNESCRTDAYGYPLTD